LSTFHQISTEEVDLYEEHAGHGAEEARDLVTDSSTCVLGDRLLSPLHIAVLSKVKS